MLPRTRPNSATPCARTLDIPVAILAGGLATRLRPRTEKIPKSLIPVAGKPFLAHQLELLRSRGLQRVVLCVGYLGEMIQREFGDGSALGVKLDYSFDSPQRSDLPGESGTEAETAAGGSGLLGTGGAIKRALPLLSMQFFVLYGDSYLPIEYRPVAEFFRRSGKLGCMTVYRNEGRYDTSNVVFRDGNVLVYDKQQRLPEMQHIDYGLSLFQATVFNAYPADKPFDLAAVMGRLVQEKQLAGYEVRERFYEIGSPAGLAELEKLLTAKQG
jgi:NDP-sugar pyrophosphorylase family protein